MTIRKKLSLSFFVMVVLISLVGGLCFVGLNMKNNEMNEIFQKDLTLLVQSVGMETDMLQNRRSEKDYLLNIGKPEVQKKYLEHFEKKAVSIREKIQQVEQLGRKDQNLPQGLKQQLTTLASLYETYHQAVMNLVGQLKNQPDLSPIKANEIMTPHKGSIHNLESIIEATAKEVREMVKAATVKAVDNGRWMKNTVLILVAVAIFLGMLLGFFAIRSINRSLFDILEHLDAGADEMGSAFRQVAMASQTLAQGASEQAASLEESASSLEEMSAMTTRNAANADQANRLSEQTRTTTLSCSNAMQEMAAAIGQVSEASQETQRIVKTIDQIAFQTNLLALNAAVEAARAGEAGAGFAVVAEEVRNLAMRSAEAAKDTTRQIEDISNKINDAMETLFKTVDEFAGVDTNTGKVSELVGEIASASSEQAQGIEQVNLAVAQMGKVVQLNAASAEENASATAQMNAQIVQIKEFANELLMLVNGNTNHQPPSITGTTGKEPKLHYN
jgi:methyl-accepting chemotaxis protein